MENIYSPSDIVDRVTAVSELRGISKRRVLIDCGFGLNTFVNMKKSMPSAGNLAKIADRLGCSVDYLLGRTSEILTPGAGQKTVEASGRLSTMISLFAQLSEAEQERLIGRLQEILEPIVGAPESKKKDAAG